MTSHELARKLLELPDVPVRLSVADPKDAAYTDDVSVKVKDKRVVVAGWVSNDNPEACAPWSVD
jgi:hypothetical protein